MSTKVSEDKLFVIDSFVINDFKTKSLYLDLKNLILFLLFICENGLDKNFKLASSNIPRISTLNQKGINVKDLITYDKIFMEKKSIDEITKRLRE